MPEGEPTQADMDALRSTMQSQINAGTQALTDEKAKTTDLEGKLTTVTATAADAARDAEVATVLATYGQYGLTAEDLKDVKSVAEMTNIAKDKQIASLTSGDKPAGDDPNAKKDDKPVEGDKLKEEPKSETPPHNPGGGSESEGSGNDLAGITPLGLLTKAFSGE